MLQRASELGRRNRVAPGIDRATITDVEQHGVDRLLLGLSGRGPQGRSYRPLQARRVFNPKPATRSGGTFDPRDRDRIAQAVPQLAIEPVVEADF